MAVGEKMKRLLRIGFDIFITSFTSIISWFLIGIIIDKNLTNVFSLTYPLQCLMGIIVSIFGVGANICVHKDENKNAADNGIFLGLIISCVIFGFIAINSKYYINFMNMKEDTYLTFFNYSITQILLQTILQLVVTKLYYLEQNKQANLVVILFNTINFFALIITALVSNNQLITSLVTLLVLLVFDLILLFKYIDKIDFKLNLKNCFKYDAVSCSISIMFFIIYLFGFSNSFSFGEKYVIAITFTTLVTDIQWDMYSAIKTVAKIDIVKKKFDYTYHFKNALKFILILVASVLLMSIIMYPVYKPQITIVSIFILLHLYDFLITPFKNIKICYLELEQSTVKITVNTIIAYILRIIISFLPTPFCTVFGQVCSSTYEFIYANIAYKKV